MLNAMSESVLKTFQNILIEFKGISLVHGYQNSVELAALAGYLLREEFDISVDRSFRETPSSGLLQTCLKRVQGCQTSFRIEVEVEHYARAKC